MQSEECLNNLNDILCSVMLLNDRNFYPEDEEDEDPQNENETVAYFKEPLSKLRIHLVAWHRHSDFCKIRGFLNLYLKLFLTYFISCIQEGDFLSKDVLKDIQSMKLETWADFPYIDTGIKIGKVLNTLFLNMITRKGYIQYHSISFSNLIDDIESPSTRAVTIESICPGLHIKDTDTVPRHIINDMLEQLTGDHSLIYLQSHILYQIIKREEKLPTILGNEIVKKASCLNCFLEDSWLTDFFSWNYEDITSKSCIYAGVLGPEVLYFHYFDYPYPFNYSIMITVYQLIDKIEEYQSLYL